MIARGGGGRYTAAMLQYKRVGVTAKAGLDESDPTVTTIVSILRSVRELKDHSIPLLSVNRGAVGFLAETSAAEAESLIPTLLEGGGELEERTLLHVKVLRGAEAVFEGIVLNEAVIAQGAIARILSLKASVGGEELTTFRSDGLILATPTGSTAYSLAAGGPIVHPRLSAIILTPLNPHSFSQKPLVIPGTLAVEVEVLKKENKYVDSEVNLTLDGQRYIPLQAKDRVVVTLNGKSVKFLRRRGDTFFATLRTKLKWGERPTED